MLLITENSLFVIAWHGPYLNVSLYICDAMIIVEAAMRGDGNLKSGSRTISLPSINNASKRTSVYVSPDTPPSTPVGKTMPKDHDETTASGEA